MEVLPILLLVSIFILLLVSILLAMVVSMWPWYPWYNPWMFWYFWPPMPSPELELSILESYKKALEIELKMIEDRINSLKGQLGRQ